MALPVPYDRPIVPAIFYDSQHPPVRPDLDLGDEIIFARDYICAQICNMAGFMSNHNPARMFCYNLLIYNHWDNADFNEVYRLVCGLILFRQRKGNLNDIRMSANECIHQVLSMYSAHLANNYPELMKQLNVNQIKGVQDLTVPFLDLKAMAESALNDRDPQQYIRRATDIVFKCKDLYTLDSNTMIQDCQHVHDVMKQQPFRAKQYTSRVNFNPTNTKPLTPPKDFSIEQSQMRQPVELPSHYDSDYPIPGIANDQQPFRHKESNMYPSWQSHGGPPQNFTSDIRQQMPPRLTPEQLQNGMPLPRTQQEAINAEGFDINLPELGYFPPWHPGHFQWLQRRTAKYKEQQDQLAIHNYQTYGTPLPDHLKHYTNNQGANMHTGFRQQPMPHQNFQHPQHHNPGGYHNFQHQQQAPMQHQQQPMPRFGQPQQQQMFAPRQMQGYYIPDIPFIQILGEYQNGDRVVVAQSGQQVYQQFIAVNTNLNSAMNPGHHTTFMHSQSPGADQYDTISPAMRSSMARFDNRPMPKIEVPQFKQPARTNFRPPNHSEPAADNTNYFRRSPPPMSKQAEDLIRRTQVRQESPENEWAEELISQTCNEEEQMAIRGYVKSPQQTQFESRMDDRLPFETPPIRPTNEIPVSRQANKPTLKPYETNQKGFLPRKPLLLKGGNEMDRSKHQMVKFGGVVRYSLESKFEELKTSVDKLASAPANVQIPVVKPIEQTEIGDEVIVDVPEMEVLSVDDYIIYPGLLMDPSLDAAIMTSRMCKLEHGRKVKQDKVFRSFNVSCEMLISNADIEDHVNALRHTHNFGHLVATIKKIVNQHYETVQEKNDILLVMTEIDRKLTEKTNEFLRYKLGIPTRISEFSTDITDLKAYLIDYYKDDRFAVAFDRFEDEIMSSVTNELDDDDFNDMKNGMRINDDVYTSYFPFLYSFTHINLTSEELGFNDQSFRDNVLQIDLENHAVLYKLIHSLDMNKLARDDKTVTDYLITSDGVRFRLFVNYLDDYQFSIARELDV